MIRRREFISLLGGAAAAWPMAVRAQISSAPRVGILMNLVATETRAETYITAFVQELRQLGRIEGQNLRLDIRWSGGDAQLARIYAAQLIGLMPDAILAVSTTNLRAIQEQPARYRSCSRRSLTLWRKAS
jgi:putative ABC transport system substrate-binding protein